MYEIECKKSQDICLSIVNCVRTFIIFDLPLFFPLFWSIRCNTSALCLGVFFFQQVHCVHVLVRLAMINHVRSSDRVSSTRDPLVVEVFRPSIRSLYFVQTRALSLF